MFCIFHSYVFIIQTNFSKFYNSHRSFQIMVIFYITINYLKQLSIIGFFKGRSSTTNLLEFGVIMHQLNLQRKHWLLAFQWLLASGFWSEEKTDNSAADDAIKSPNYSFTAIALDNCNHVEGLYTNFSKAFDRIGITKWV